MATSPDRDTYENSERVDGGRLDGYTDMYIVKCCPRDPMAEAVDYVSELP